MDFHDTFSWIKGVFSKGEASRNWKFYSLFTFLFIEVFTSLAVVYNLLQSKDVKEFISRAPIAFAIMMSIAKFSNFRMNQKNIGKTVKYLNNLEEKCEDEIFKKNSEFCRKLGFYFVSINMILILFIDVQILFSSNDFDLFYNFFFSVQNKVQYYIVYGIESAQLALMGIGHLNIELVNYFLMLHLETHLNYIMKKLGKIKVPLEKGDQKLNVQELKSIIRHHNETVMYVMAPRETLL